MQRIQVVSVRLHGQFINVLAYADDFVIITPSWRAMQHLLDVLSVETLAIDMTCNPKNTVCMVFKPKRQAFFYHLRLVAMTYSL